MTPTPYTKARQPRQGRSGPPLIARSPCAPALESPFLPVASPGVIPRLLRRIRRGLDPVSLDKIPVSQLLTRSSARSLGTPGRRQARPRVCGLHPPRGCPCPCRRSLPACDRDHPALQSCRCDPRAGQVIRYGSSGCPDETACMIHRSVRACILPHTNILLLVTSRRDVSRVIPPLSMYRR